MPKRETASAEAVEQLSREIRAQRRQVQDALEYSLQPGIYDGTVAKSRLHHVFASFQGVDDTPPADKASRRQDPFPADGQASTPDPM
jgi:hypothetical protein